MDNLDKLQVPTEMRAAAEKNVDLARSAFDQFLSAARSNFVKVDDAAQSNRAKLKDFNSQNFEYMEQNINAAFDLAKHLVNAKDIQEATQLQADFIRKQFGAMQAQAKAINLKTEGSK